MRIKKGSEVRCKIYSSKISTHFLYKGDLYLRATFWIAPQRYLHSRIYPPNFYHPIGNIRSLAYKQLVMPYIYQPRVPSLPWCMSLNVKSLVSLRRCSSLLQPSLSMLGQNYYSVFSELILQTRIPVHWSVLLHLGKQPQRLTLPKLRLQLMV